jgi:hypothetical protein
VPAVHSCIFAFLHFEHLHTGRHHSPIPADEKQNRTKDDE